MLTFKDYGYTDHERVALQEVLAAAYLTLGQEVCRDGTDCKECPYRRVCGDLARLIKYVHTRTRKACDSQES